jgi:hypothetical protein
VRAQIFIQALHVNLLPLLASLAPKNRGGGEGAGSPVKWEKGLGGRGRGAGAGGIKSPKTFSGGTPGPPTPLAHVCSGVVSISELK